MSAENRRGSSLFSGPGAGAGEKTQLRAGAPTPKPLNGTSQPSGGATRRASNVMMPGALGGGLGFGIDFDDSDYEDSDDDDGPPPGANPSGKGGATAGGPNHRPYVGGFAAAAYEAAKAHHSTQSKMENPEEPRPSPPSGKQQQNEKA